MVVDAVAYTTGLTAVVQPLLMLMCMQDDDVPIMTIIILLTEHARPVSFVIQAARCLAQ